MREDEDPFREVTQALPVYLPVLAAVVRSASPFQQDGAALAAQGYLLSSLMALHHLQFAAQEQECKEAVLFSDLAKDRNLQVYARMQLASAYHGKDPVQALHIYRQAARFIDEVSPLIRGKWWIEQAITHAQCGEEDEAMECLETFHAALPLEPGGDLTSLYADYTPQLCLWEGMAYVNLGYLARDLHHVNQACEYYQQAWKTLLQIEVDDPRSSRVAAGRLRAKAYNQQAEAALALEDFTSCCRCLEKGGLAANVLRSPLLQQEARALLHTASIRWPQEQRLSALKAKFDE
jgi:tetratricopeptide (TPR) repeat protein